MMALWAPGPRDALTAFTGVQSSTGVDKEQTRIKILVIFAFQVSGRRPPKSFLCDKQTVCQAARDQIPGRWEGQNRLNILERAHPCSAQGRKSIIIIRPSTANAAMVLVSSEKALRRCFMTLTQIVLFLRKKWSEADYFSRESLPPEVSLRLYH